jgi:hypothetical protein
MPVTPIHLAQLSDDVKLPDIFCRTCHVLIEKGISESYMTAAILPCALRHQSLGIFQQGTTIETQQPRLIVSASSGSVHTSLEHA